MDREALMKQLADLLEKDELKEKFEAVSSMEEMRALLRENGMNEDDKTLDALIEEVARFISDDGELNEEDLGDVSGGNAVVLAWRVMKHVIKSGVWNKLIQMGAGAQSRMTDEYRNSLKLRR